MSHRLQSRAWYKLARGGLLGVLLGLAAWLGSALPAQAQTPAAPAPGAPAPGAQTAPPASSPAGAEAPPPAPAPSAPTSSDYACVPECRKGFVCVRGQCVSACNPPCGAAELCNVDRCVSACNPPCAASEQCTDQGQCLAPAPVAPPPEPAPTVTYSSDPSRPLGELSQRDDGINERRASGKRFHDGFYVRLGVGAGYLVSAGNTGDDPTNRGAQAFTVPVEFALGGTPAPGVVIGGGAWGVHIPSAEYTIGRGDRVRVESASYGSFSMLGPFLDVYLAPRFGFHVQAAPCISVVSLGESDTTSALSGFGFGAMGGLGYEGWVSDQWGIGILARVQYVSASLSDDSELTLQYVALAPSLLLTATLH